MVTKFHHHPCSQLLVAGECTLDLFLSLFLYIMFTLWTVLFTHHSLFAIIVMVSTMEANLPAGVLLMRLVGGINRMFLSPPIITFLHHQFRSPFGVLLTMMLV
jgi:hypothetical protein